MNEMSGDISNAETEKLDFNISLNGIRFDPLVMSPPIPRNLKLNSPNGYYIVQCNGPILQEWQDKLKEEGVIIHGYIPNFAYLVYMNNITKAKVKRLPFCLLYTSPSPRD